jgi:hypothetical protein
MPRALRVVLKAVWSILAWVLLLSGVIGCGEVPRPEHRALDGAAVHSTSAPASAHTRVPAP